MKREIKFRGKTITDGQWIIGSLIQFDNLLSGHHISFIRNQDTPMTSIDIQTIGQYSGLKDSKGVEIFEGDIINGVKRMQADCDGSNAYPVLDTVSVRCGCFTLYSKPMSSFHVDFSNHSLNELLWREDKSLRNDGFNYYQIDQIEVVGNIHDNLELPK